MFVNTTTLEVKGESELRALYSNTSFPQPFQPPEGWEVLFATPQPTYDPIIEVIVPGTPILTHKGHWEQTWVTQPRFSEYTDSEGVLHTVEEQIAAAQAFAQQQRTQLILQQCDQRLTQHLDSTAQAKRYDNRISCALRAGYPGPFQSEGIAFATWMDTCNALGYQFLAEIMAGTRPVPQNPQELIDALPPMVWPE